MTPTPADLARRPAPTPRPRAAAPHPPAPTAPSAAEAAIAPGRLEGTERFKPMYHRGLMVSGMHPEARLMGFALLWYAHHRTGRISPNFQPSLAQLAADTGFNAARVGVQIEVLRQRGWLRLTPIADGPRAGRPRFELTIPAVYLERIRAHRSR